MKAVIMAGGKGSRLRPLTCNKPKPMVPVLNKPVMEYAIELLRKHNITDIAVTLQYLPEKIKNYFGDGSRFGVNLYYFDETIPLGTAGSVKNAEEFLDETFLVISGDGLTDYDLEDAINYHRAKKGIATLVMAKVDNPLEYGVIMCDDNGKIIRFLEKPSWGEVFSDTVNTGIYVIEPEVFKYFEKNAFFDFSRDLFPLLMKKGEELFGFRASGYWSDIGSVEQYRQTHFDLLDGLVNIPLNVNKIEDGLWIGENTYIHTDVRFDQRPIFIGDNCYIDKDVEIGEYSIIGNNNTIRSSSSIKRSIFWDYNYIDDNVEIRGGIICKHGMIQSNSSIFEGTIIGNDCFLGNRVTVKPNVKLWPEKRVEDNSVINTSVIWSNFYKRNLFSTKGISGKINIDITPDMAVKLALAYGVCLPVGANVVLSSDSNPFSQVIKNSIKSGLLTSGVTVSDIGECTTPVCRYAVKNLQIKGGIHIRNLEPLEKNKVLIEILDDKGINISKDFERKIETAFYQEDFRRVASQQLGEEKYFQKVKDLYREELVAAIQVDLINQQNLKVLLACDTSNKNCYLPVLENLGCQVKIVDKKNYQLQDLISLVLQNKLDLGIILTSNADQAIFITEDGRIIKDEILLCLWAYIVLSSKKDNLLGVPITAPSIIETMAEQYGGKIIWTKANPRSIMEVTQDRIFQPYFDGIYMAVNILEFLTVQKKKLSEVIGCIPRSYLHKQMVKCPWGDKGLVMRRLIEEMKGQKVELIDGIKIYHNNGWALILPDHEEPLFRVVSESNNPETAEKIATDYADKIQHIRAM